MAKHDFVLNIVPSDLTNMHVNHPVSKPGDEA